jgi:hypothetical protein
MPHRTDGSPGLSVSFRRGGRRTCMNCKICTSMGRKKIEATHVQHTTHRNKTNKLFLCDRCKEFMSSIVALAPNAHITFEKL